MQPHEPEPDGVTVRSATICGADNMTEHLPAFSDDIKSRWIVKRDEAGDEFIRLNGRKALLNGGLDHVYLISSDRVGVWLTRQLSPFNRLAKKVPTLKIEQSGNGESVLSCDIKHLDDLCEAVNAKRRHRLTDEQRAKKRSHALAVFGKTSRQIGTSQAAESIII